MRYQWMLPILLLLSTPGLAQPPNESADGRCEGHTLATTPGDSAKVDQTWALRVIRAGAPVYAQAEGDAPASDSLGFGLAVEPLRVAAAADTGRIQIKRPSDREALGWMDRADLLCRFTPLRTAPTGGIERKAFIRTAPAVPGQVPTVQAYPGPQLTDCAAGGGCKALSRFDLLFVYAEDPRSERQLLAFEHSLLDDEVKPVGWVQATQTIPWHTRFGLRPSDQVEKTWLYASPDAAFRRNRSLAFPVLGNRDGRWYGYPMHLPLVDKEQFGGRWLYKIAAPGPQLNIGEDPYASIDEEAIKQLKGVDVLFLIDGTRSMGPFVVQAADRVETLADELAAGNTGHSTNHFRFGYRIYRDRFADAPSAWGCTNGVCEGLPLDRTDCGFAPAKTEASRDQVVKGLRAVKTSEEQIDGYPEALFAGIGQAIDDLGGCDGRLKVLVVIGDHGDNAAAVPAELRRKIENTARNFLVFFIQTPKAKSAGDYTAAYTKFQTDADAVLRLVISQDSFLGQPLEAERARALLHLGDAAATGQAIRDLIARYSSSSAVNEVLDAIRGGEALDAYLVGRMQQGDLPVLFWKRVYDKLCDDEDRRLGRQCTEPVNQVVDYAWAPVGDDWTPEVWLDVPDVDFWLNTLERLREPSGGSAEAQRQAFVGLLLDVLQRQVGRPPIPDTGETFEQFVLRRGALPVREQSPLLGYDLATLRQIEPCELRRLQSWSGQVHDLLATIKASPTFKPELRLQDYSDNCAGLSDSGRRIQSMQLTSPSAWGLLSPDGTGSYEHDLRGVRYWLPQAFLP
jgi:hypothetical protein